MINRLTEYLSPTTSTRVAGVGQAVCKLSPPATLHSPATFYSRGEWSVQEERHKSLCKPGHSPSNSFSAMAVQGGGVDVGFFES